VAALPVALGELTCSSRREAAVIAEDPSDAMVLVKLLRCQELYVLIGEFDAEVYGDGFLIQSLSLQREIQSAGS
jgi:hypothetical protein